MELSQRADIVIERMASLRAAIRARLEADQARLIPHLRTIARELVAEFSSERVREVAEVLGSSELLDLFDDIERMGEAERARLRVVAVDERLRNPTDRADALDRRHQQALDRISSFSTELSRFDADAFQWLRARSENKARANTPTEQFLRAITFARWREERAEAALRDSVGHETFDAASQAYYSALKGLQRAELESERTAHARAALADLLAERADLETRVAEHAAYRLRRLRESVEMQLVCGDLCGVLLRAPEALQPAIAEAHAVEVRMRGWQDLDIQLERSLEALHQARGPAFQAGSLESTTFGDMLDAAESLSNAISKVVDVLAAFHDFERWQTAIAANEGQCCWRLFADGCCVAEQVDESLLPDLLPRLMQRSPRAGLG